MSKVRYKIRREQLERVVEHFVMESAMIEKNAAKKHKMSMGTEQSDDMGDGMIPAKEVKNPKMKQAPEVKKNIHGKVNENDMSGVDPEAKDFVEELKSTLSPKEFEKLQGMAQNVKAKLESGMQEEGFRDTFNKIKGKIGGILSAAGIGGLGLFGAKLETLASQGNYGVDLSDPMFITSVIALLAGATMVASRISDVNKQSVQDKKERDLANYRKKYGTK